MCKAKRFLLTRDKERFCYTIGLCISSCKGNTMQVAKWGNSLAIRLPAAVVKALTLKEGDDIEVLIAGERAFEISKKQTRSDFLNRLREFRNRLPADYSFSRLEAAERKPVKSLNGRTANARSKKLPRQ
jgi:antitoxin MazE